MKRSAFIALILLAIIQEVIAQDNVKPLLGKYSCIVQVAYPNRDWAKEYIGSRLEYDADKGVLDPAFAHFTDFSAAQEGADILKRGLLGHGDQFDLPGVSSPSLPFPTIPSSLT